MLTRAPCSSSTISNLSTLSLSRKVARFSRRWWQNSSAISWSTNGNSQCPRQPIELQDIVAREYSVTVERDMRSASSLRTRSDDDLACLDDARGGSVDVFEANGVWRDKRGRSSDELDIVAHQLMAGHVELVLDHPVGAEQQILHRDVLFHGVGSAVEFSCAVPAKIERRLAQGLRRYSAEIDAASAEHRLSFDDRDLLIELRTLDCGALPGRPGANHQKIVVESLSGHPPAPLWVDPAGCYLAACGPSIVQVRKRRNPVVAVCRWLPISPSRNQAP